MKPTVFVCHVKTSKHFSVDRDDFIADQKNPVDARKYREVDQQKFLRASEEAKQIAFALKFLADKGVLTLEMAEKLYPVPPEPKRADSPPPEVLNGLPKETELASAAQGNETIPTGQITPARGRPPGRLTRQNGLTKWR